MRFLAKITSSCIWVAIPVDWVILHWYMPVVRTDGRSVGVRSRDYQVFSDGRITTFSYPWCFAMRALREKAPLWKLTMFNSVQALGFFLKLCRLSITNGKAIGLTGNVNWLCLFEISMWFTGLVPFRLHLWSLLHLWPINVITLALSPLKGLNVLKS